MCQKFVEYLFILWEKFAFTTIILKHIIIVDSLNIKIDFSNIWGGENII